MIVHNLGKFLHNQFAKLYVWNKILRWNEMNFALLRVPYPIFESSFHLLVSFSALK